MGDETGEPAAWHCGSCGRVPAPAGLSRRGFLQVATATALTVGLAGGRAARAGARPPVQPLTSRSAPADALSRGAWLAGDTHVHSDHSSDGSATRQGSGHVLPGNVSVADQIGQAARMGLDFLPITDHRTYDQHWDPLWSSADVLLIPGEEANGSPHATVHGCIDEVVDGAGVPGSHPYRHLQQSIWEVRAQGGVWSTAHPDDGEYEGGRTNANAEAVGVDVVEVWNRGSAVDTEIEYAENRWNAGWRFGGVGGCDCHFRELWGIAGPGMPTTYVHAVARTERAVLDALRAGRTSVSADPTGAFLTLEADLDGDGVFEALGGDEVTGLTAGGPAVLRVRVQRGAGGTLTVFAAPGRAAPPVLTETLTGSDQTFLVPVTVPQGHGWWRAEVRRAGTPTSVDTNAVKGGALGTTSALDQLQAFVSPVFTSTGDGARPQQALPLPGQAGAEDGAVLALGERGRFTGFPCVATTTVRGRRVVHLVAEQHVPGGTTVVHRLLDGSETRLTTSTAARLPRVAAHGQLVHVVWQDERTGQLPRRADIWLRTSTDGGRTWGPERRVSTSSGRSERPAVAVDPADPTRPWVAWTDNQSLADTTGPLPGAGAAAFDVLVSRGSGTPVNLSAPGKTTDPGTATDTRSPRWPASLHPSITVRPDGGVVVGWQDNRFDPTPGWTGATPPPGSTSNGPQGNPDAWEPMVAVREPGGAWSPPVRVAPDPAASARHPQVLAEPSGRVVAIWSWKVLQGADANLQLRAATSDDGGRTWSAPVAVDAFPAAMMARPRLGTDPDGSTRAVWADTRSADWRWRVRSARLGPGGWSAGTDLSTVGNGTYPATSGGVTAFTSDRAAAVQRDVTQQVHVVGATSRRAGLLA